MSLINRILSYLNVSVNKASSLKVEKLYYENKLKKLSQFYLATNAENAKDINAFVSGIVFSKDRAMQLHALLSSYFYYTKNYGPLTILYTYSDANHERSYNMLQEEMKHFPVTFIKETDFAGQLIEVINQADADRLFFLTDDGIFIDHYDLNDSLYFDPVKHIFSLRLGADLDFCYSYNIPQKIPSFHEMKKEGAPFYCWNWDSMTGSPDWIYPLSVDATVFFKKEMEMLLNQLEFKNPNSLEYQMQQYNDLFLCRTGVCYAKVKYVNVPCNIVQSEFENISTGAFSTGELLHHFLAGKRIDWKIVEKWKARDVQLMKYSFIPAMAI
ncbi:MAG: hypothetical protein ACOYLO_11000 [Ferruginibacter sp.]